MAAPFFHPVACGLYSTGVIGMLPGRFNVRLIAPVRMRASMTAVKYITYWRHRPR